jgi:response regulator NasT
LYDGAAVTTTPSVGTVNEQALRVLLADEDKAALRRLGDVLDQLGHETTPYAVSVQEAADLIAREDPDLTIVVADHDDDHALALISEAIEFARGPVLAQLRGDSDVDLVARAAERGIAAYIASAQPDEVQGAIEVSMRRYREAQRLIEKVDQLETALERRTVIERAKGILMERHGIAEREAFERLREQARAGSRRVVDVARAVLEGHSLLPPRP